MRDLQCANFCAHVADRWAVLGTARHKGGLGYSFTAVGTGIVTTKAGISLCSPPDEMQCQISGQVVGVIKPTPEEERKGLQAKHSLPFRDEVPESK